MCEEIRVVSRHADHGQDLAGTGVDHHRSPRALVVAAQAGHQRSRCRDLQLEVDRQVHRVARDRRLRIQHAHDLAPRIDHLVRPAVDPAQPRLQAGLDADLADELIGLVALALEGVHLRLVDRRHITDDMTEQCGVQIRAYGPARDGHAWKRGDALGDPQLLRLREARANRDASVGVGIRDLDRQSACVDAHQSGQRIDLRRARRGGRRKGGWNHLNAPRRSVLHQRYAVAVVDDAALGLDDDSVHRVFARQRGERRALGDLHLRKLHREHPEGQHRHHRGRGQAQRPARARQGSSQRDVPDGVDQARTS